MTAELELHRETTNDLAGQVEYAKLISAGSLLPETYRGKPANVLIAMGLGQSMGLSPAESLYRIDVIQGKPTAAAELIAANVRKAGHKLRMRVTEEPPSATCTIIRLDDPDEPYVITRDMEWAQRMKLVGKDNYLKQPATMLSWRAISACARLACSEALYGVQYTPDELGDLRPAVEPRTGGLAAALADDEPPVAPPLDEQHDDAQPSDEPVLLNVRSKLAKAMFAAIGEAGITDKERLGWVSTTLGREITTSTEMTEDDARTVLDTLSSPPWTVDPDADGAA